MTKSAKAERVVPMTETTTEGITVVDGVEIDISVRGDADRAHKVMIDLKERLGRLAAAYEEETPPSELPEDLTETHPEKTPMMTVAWERVFNGDTDE